MKAHQTRCLIARRLTLRRQQRHSNLQASQMKNARVSALIYEMLYICYWMIDDNQGKNSFDFFHKFTSAYEWLAECLGETGVLRRTRTGGVPLLSLQEVRLKDFREFESFDNYCYFMFTYDQIFDQTQQRSPYFRQDIAERDDIFIVSDGVIILDDSRFKEKVMTRWRELDVRQIRPVL